MGSAGLTVRYFVEKVRRAQNTLGRGREEYSPAAAPETAEATKRSVTKTDQSAG